MHNEKKKHVSDIIVILIHGVGNTKPAQMYSSVKEILEPYNINEKNIFEFHWNSLIDFPLDSNSALKLTYLDELKYSISQVISIRLSSLRNRVSFCNFIKLLIRSFIIGSMWPIIWLVSSISAFSISVVQPCLGFIVFLLFGFFTMNDSNKVWEKPSIDVSFIPQVNYQIFKCENLHWEVVNMILIVGLFWLLIIIFVDVIGFALKILSDIFRYLGDYNYYSLIQKGLKNKLNSIEPLDSPIIIVGHSLGSIIAVDSLLSFDSIWKNRSSIRLVTMGSPLSRFFSSIFPEMYPCPIQVFNALNSNYKDFYWINIFRPFDPVGTSLCKNTDECIKDISSKQFWKTPMTAHFGYWDDKKIAELIKNEIDFNRASKEISTNENLNFNQTRWFHITSEKTRYKNKNRKKIDKNKKFIVNSLSEADSFYDFLGKYNDGILVKITNILILSIIICIMIFEYVVAPINNSKVIKTQDLELKNHGVLIVSDLYWRIDYKLVVQGTQYGDSSYYKKINSFCIQYSVNGEDFRHQSRQKPSFLNLLETSDNSEVYKPSTLDMLNYHVDLDLAREKIIHDGDKHPSSFCYTTNPESPSMHIETPLVYLPQNPDIYYLPNLNLSNNKKNLTELLYQLCFYLLHFPLILMEIFTFYATFWLILIILIYSFIGPLLQLVMRL